MKEGNILKINKNWKNYIKWQLRKEKLILIKMSGIILFVLLKKIKSCMKYILF